jgi:hypothetical protein
MKQQTNRIYFFSKKENRKRKKAVDLKIQKSGTEKINWSKAVFIAQGRNCLERFVGVYCDESDNAVQNRGP